MYTSDLKRALWTAQQIHAHQLQDPKPSLIETDLIREQHFGEAESQHWAPPGAQPRNPGQKVYPVPEGRDGRFDGGESPNDVRRRVGEAFDTFVVPHLEKSKGQKPGEVNIVFVSHGIAIAETIGAIFARCVDGKNADPDTWRGLKNTAWTRLVIGLEGEELDYPEELLLHPAKPLTSKLIGGVPNVDSGEMIATAVEEASHHGTSGKSEVSTQALPSIIAKVVAVNQYDHLEGIIRQKGGIGSAAHDDKQKAITDFFGGGGAKGGSSKI
ncbi:hypothetical protein FRC02_009390 [Tulasnella sp. 418]|nr:hypothetical protein FRC02_009390 [Tulasnella sp. 418]